MYNYLSYLPQNYQTEKLLPLIIFLHGTPQRGDDLKLLKKEALPYEMENGLKIPAIVIAPQCPQTFSWETNKLYALYENICNTYKVDKTRVYLTGFSMGGFGTLKFARDYPDLFAAIAPVCSGGSKFIANFIKNIPVWFFHGDKDEIIDIKKTKELVDELIKLNANVKFTEYSDLGHNTWTPTYKKQELYDWLLSFKKNI
jgi:predicted peptidase